jgi:hypothetical protein
MFQFFIEFKRRFSSSQIERIKSLKVFDMVVSVTKMLAEDIKENPFRVPTEGNNCAYFLKAF